MLRFTIGIGIGAALLVASVVVGVAVQFRSDQASFGENALYTGSVTIEDGVEGTAVDVWGSSDGRRVFVAFKLNDDAISKMPTDASRYATTVACVSQAGAVQDMPIVPSASTYVFGSTGYIGTYLVAGEAFQPQLYRIYYNANDTSGNNVTWSVTINPAASGVTHSDLLDNRTFEPAALYKQTVAISSERELREQLVSDLDDMYENEQSILEFRDRLSKASVVTTGILPEYVRGDNIQKDDDGNYTVSFATTVPGGLDIDWQSTSVAHGGSYIELAEQALGVSSYADVIAAVADTALATGTTSQQVTGALSTDPTAWYMQDGSSVSEARAGLSESSYNDITTSISRMSSACASYVSAKQRYQTTDTMALLAFENDVSNLASVITSSDATIYQGE